MCVCDVYRLTIYMVECLSKMIATTPAVMNWEHTHIGNRKTVSTEEHYFTPYY